MPSRPPSVPGDTTETEEQGPAKRSPGRVVTDTLRSADPRKIDSRYGRRPLYILAIIFITGAWDEHVLAVLGPEIREDFGVSLTFMATITTVVSMSDMFLAPVIGYFADRLNRVRMMGFGSIAANVSSVVSGFAPSPGAFLATRVSAAGATLINGPTVGPLLADWYPQGVRARVFAFVSLVGNSTAIVGPIMAGIISEFVGWRPAVIGFALLAIALSFLLFTLPHPPRGYYDRIALGADEEAARREQPPMGWSEAWRAAASIETVRRMWYATPFLTVAGNAMRFFLPYYYAEEFGLGPSARGAIASLFFAVGLVALAFAGPVGDRLLQTDPARLMAVLGVLFTLNIIPVLVLIFSGLLWLSIAFGVLLGFVAALVGPGIGALMSLIVPARMRGLGMQTFKPWEAAGMVVYPLVIAASGGNLRTGLIAVIPIFLIGSLLLTSAAAGVSRDIRAATAAAMADEEARRSKEEGRTKLLVGRDIDVTYDGTQVLFNVDFDVEEGELVALVGTNGAGKSTLLRAIAGVQEASNGAIFLDGRDITHRPPGENAKDGVVFVPGGRAIFPGLTVAENLRTAAYLQRDDEAWVAEQTEVVLELFPALRARLDDLAGNMSGGEQQMLALGQAFVMKPKILMIDELSLGLAPAVVERLLEVVRRINAGGTTVILVEQSINVALTVARRAVFLEKGRVRFDGPTEDLLGRSDLVRAVFLSGTGGSGGQPARVRRRVGEEEVERVLDVANVDVAYGGVKALDGASLEVDAGQIVGIIGPNGAGKTTLLDVISGFVKPDAGEITIAGTDATGLSPDARARLGLARSFQNARLFGSLTVRETLAVALERKLDTRSAALAAVWAPQVRRSERRVRRRVEWLIDAFALEAFADKFVTELSTGSRRIVDLACIAAVEPKLLLLDEPSSGLAQAESEALAPVVRRLVRDTGCGVVVIEHDIPLITSLADRLVAMELGTPIIAGDPHEVVAHPRVVEAYLGADRSVIERSGPLATALNAAGLNPENKEHH